MKKTQLTIAYYSSILILGLFTALTGPALPSLAENTSSTLDQISLIFLFGSLGYLLGSFLGGLGFDRLPRHRLLALTLLAISLSGALVPVFRQLWGLILAQFVLGLAHGMNDVGCNTLLLWIHGDQSGPYVNGLHFFFGVGASIGPLVLAATLALSGSVQGAYWVFAVLCLPLSGWIWTLPDEPLGEEQENAGQTPVAIFPLLLLVLAFTFYVGGEVGFGSWIYTYALTRGLGTALTSAYLTSAFWGAFTAARLFGVWLSTRLRPAVILILDLFGCLASLSLLLVWPDSNAALWTAAIGTGVFMASVFPSMLILAGDRLPVTGSVTGWFLVGGGMGGMILPWVIGIAFAGIGAGTMPWLIMGSISLNLIVILLFNTRTSPLPISDR